MQIFRNGNYMIIGICFEIIGEDSKEMKECRRNKIGPILIIAEVESWVT